MVSLATGEQSIAEISADERDTLLDRTLSLPLRDRALWYPDIPGKNLYLNESSFTSKDIPPSEFAPLSYDRFGPSDGFDHLAEITVFFFDHILHAIEFRDDIGNSQLLGDKCATERQFELVVDGVNGERLETIDVGIEFPSRIRPKPSIIANYGRIIGINASRIFTVHDSRVDIQCLYSLC